MWNRECMRGQSHNLYDSLPRVWEAARSNEVVVL
jgi:hypothetical protein